MIGFIPVLLDAYPLLQPILLSQRMAFSQLRANLSNLLQQIIYLLCVYLGFTSVLRTREIDLFSAVSQPSVHSLLLMVRALDALGPCPPRELPRSAVGILAARFSRMLLTASLLPVIHISYPAIVTLARLNYYSRVAVKSSLSIPSNPSASLLNRSRSRYIKQQPGVMVIEAASV